ncbi:hypothetical protein Cpap_0153 [Ruminiclostridium papyrosolvens DSM 2782]|uniref:Flp pilus assembly protein TadB n=1 Tax=Ruminiclostridium papyrosolvens DSM 2782 TaxID=588581 RepID=F1TIG9_9FIRM|nr:hypothetical protein [Ruminiclostridium papyrosolvens]EGD45786.1 hypothetical protein Cpap_0153 [Ruminiclostridium papyrosolvens DSM 2782]WES33894.1 hypothetical protein P0092_19335 [Ruminiclostridium papyrosolvens DSM 2782]
MTFIQLTACTGFIAGCFILFGISPIEFADGLFSFLTRHSVTIRDEINEAAGRKRLSFLQREIKEMQEILSVTGRSSRFSAICLISLLLFAAGAGIAIILQNIFLIPVLAVGFMFIPFWYVRLTSTNYKKSIAAELETALSIITTAYLRNEDIFTAVEESIGYLNPPVRSIFESFLTQIRLVNPDIDAALKAMSPKIENNVFHEWCDAVSSCQYDRSLKTTLTPIVTKLSDMRIVNAELEYLVLEPRNEFITMALLVIGNIPVTYLLNRSWFNTLMNTTIGQLVLAVCAAAIFISASFVIKLTKPIEYRR